MAEGFESGASWWPGGSTAYLITGVGGAAGRALAAELSGRGRHVVGVDTRPLTTVPYPTVVVSAAGSPRYVSDLFTVCRRYGARVIVPTLAEELAVLSAAKPAAARNGITIAVADRLPVNVASDRWLTFQSLQLISVAVPKTMLAAEVVSAAEVKAHLGIPVLRKHRNPRAGRGATVHRDLRTLFDGIAEDRFVLQEFMPGADYSVNLYLDTAGVMAGSVLLKRIISNGDAGKALLVSRVVDRDIRALAIAAARAIGLQGAVEIDVRRRSDGTPAVVGINALYGAHCAMVPETIEALLAEHETRAAAHG